MPENGKPKFFYGYIIVMAVFFIFVIFNGLNYSFGVFLKPVAADFGWTRAVTSGAFSLFMLVLGFLFMVTGRLNDLYGPRIVITVCGFFLGLGFLLMSQVNSIWQLYLFYGLIIAIGISGGLAPMMSTIARWFVKRRGTVSGIAISGIGIGTMIMPPAASRLIASYGWSISYMVLGSIALVVTIAAAQFLRRDPGKMGLLPDNERGVAQQSSTTGVGGFTLREATHTVQFWLLCAALLCFGHVLMAVITHIIPYTTDLGIDSVTAANTVAIIGGLSIAGRMGMGFASDRIGDRLAMIIGFTAMSLPLLWLLIAQELWMLYLFSAVFGFGYGTLAALMSPATAELFGLKSHGTIFGIALFAHGIGCAIGPYVTGMIYDVRGSYSLAFVICAVISFIGLILTLFIRPIRRDSSTVNT